MGNDLQITELLHILKAMSKAGRGKKRRAILEAHGENRILHKLLIYLLHGHLTKEMLDRPVFTRVRPPPPESFEALLDILVSAPKLDEKIILLVQEFIRSVPRQMRDTYRQVLAYEDMFISQSDVKFFDKQEENT